MADIENTLERIKAHQGVEGVIIVNGDGVPIRPSKGFDADLTHKYASLISRLATSARSMVKELDETDQLTFFRVRTKNREILVAPEKDYMLIVISNPNL